jgi:hypothetical protein
MSYYRSGTNWSEIKNTISGSKNMSEGKFNLQNYETVKERKQRFYREFPDGRIVVTLINSDILEQALFMATIYKSAEDQELKIPMSTGYAHEIRDKELQVNQYGKKYESVNYTSWVENCEESAVGRALDNAGFSGNNKCSREEMAKVEKIIVKEQTKESKPVQSSGAYVFPDRFKKFAGQSITDQNIKEVEGYFNYLMSGAKNPADPMLMALAEAIAKFKKPVRTTPDITEKDIPF